MQRSPKEGPRPIAELIRSFLRDEGLGSARRASRVLQAWSEVVGPQLGARARPVRFRAGELTVEVDSASHFQELRSFTGEGFRVRANQRLGENVIRRVAFKLRG